MEVISGRDSAEKVVGKKEHMKLSIVVRNAHPRRECIKMGNFSDCFEMTTVTLTYFPWIAVLKTFFHRFCDVFCLFACLLVCACPGLVVANFCLCTCLPLQRGGGTGRVCS